MLLLNIRVYQQTKEAYFLIKTKKYIKNWKMIENEQKKKLGGME